ncbi:MAG TPA: two-component regulator propeller domain-containing protein, partial [Bacteroidia bacterium]
MKNIYTLIILTSLSVVNGFSQNPGYTTYYASIPTTTVTNANLGHASTFVIDNNNNKWIGFNYGNVNSFQLLKYNGTQWDTFPAFNALSPTNKVYALAVDASNNLWIGSNRGLTKYDGTTFTTYNTTNSLIKSDTIISLACNGGNVYAGSYKGLSVFNGTSFTNYNRATNGMKSDTVYCITAESASAVWLGNRFGMDKFNGSTFTFSYVAAGNVADMVNCIYLDSVNNKWIGTNAHGAIKYDNTNFYTMQQLYPNPNTLQDLIGAGYWPITVKDICKGFHGGVFFGMKVNPIGVNCKASNGSGIEITSTHLYPCLGFSPGVSMPTYLGDIMQYDLISNKIFFVNNGMNPVLYSFDPSLYVPNPDDVSTSNSAFLDINNVNALITNNSSQHWDNRAYGAKYFVPKQNNTSPLFGSAMWIGGYSNNNLHMAAETYRQNGDDFWPGPL